MDVTIFCDGAANNHVFKAQGYAPMGVGIYAVSDNGIEYMKGLYAGPGNSMEAEWCAMILAMKVAYLISKKYRTEKHVRIKLYNDNEVVVNMYNKIYSIANYKDFFRKVNANYEKLRANCTVKVQWIPREQNEIADKLSKKGRKYGENLMNGFTQTEIEY